jgi:hypothetical protein
VAVFNFAARAREVELPACVAPAGAWRLVSSTDDARYAGGGGAAPAMITGDGGGRVAVPPHSAALYQYQKDQS